MLDALKSILKFNHIKSYHVHCHNSFISENDAYSGVCIIFLQFFYPTRLFLIYTLNYFYKSYFLLIVSTIYHFYPFTFFYYYFFIHKTKKHILLLCTLYSLSITTHFIIVIIIISISTTRCA